LKAHTVIVKWSKLRRVPKEPWQKLAHVAQAVYDTLSLNDKKRMITELSEYIRSVHDGEILPGPVIT